MYKANIPASRGYMGSFGFHFKRGFLFFKPSSRSAELEARMFGPKAKAGFYTGVAAFLGTGVATLTSSIYLASKIVQHPHW